MWDRDGQERVLDCTGGARYGNIMLVVTVDQRTVREDLPAERVSGRGGQAEVDRLQRERLRRLRNLDDYKRISLVNQKRYRESNRNKSVQAQETARARRFTGVSFRGPSHDRRAWVGWAGLDVWEVVEAYKAMGYEELLREGEIPKKALDVSLGYYEAFPAEIDRAVSENRRASQDWHELFPDVIPSP